MTMMLSVLGICAGSLLTTLLLLNRYTNALGIWPAAQGSWQSFLFWFLFRSLNVSALVLAAVDWKAATEDVGFRIVAAALALIGVVVYVATCLHLGKVNLYCGKAGLVTTGIYAWSRNPQYAIAMPTYVALGFASQSMLVAGPIVLLIAVFSLMALNEEPWLQAEYGDDYRRYKATVPRFYNISRLRSLFFHRRPRAKTG